MPHHGRNIALVGALDRRRRYGTADAGRRPVVPCGPHRLQFKRRDLGIDQIEKVVLHEGGDFKRQYELRGTESTSEPGRARVRVGVEVRAGRRNPTDVRPIAES